MVKSNLKEKNQLSNAKLSVVDKNVIKTTSYSDINLKQWRDYEHVKTDTLWEFPSRLKEGGHSNEYHGNYIPQIAQQIYERYTKKDDVVLDMFFGSGTSGIEAVNMKRRCIGVELKKDLVEPFLRPLFAICHKSFLLHYQMLNLRKLYSHQLRVVLR